MSSIPLKSPPATHSGGYRGGTPLKNVIVSVRRALT